MEQQWWLPSLCPFVFRCTLLHIQHFIFRQQLLTKVSLSACFLLCLSYICLFLNFCDPEAKLGRYYDDYSPLRLSIHSLCTSHHLDLFITFIICVNVFTMSIEHYKQPVVMRALTNLLKWKMLWKMSQINLYASPYIQSVHSVFRRGSEVL